MVVLEVRYRSIIVIDLHRIVCFINLTLIWRYLDVSNTYEITRMNISFRERFH